MSIAPSIGFDYSTDPETDFALWDWVVADPQGCRLPNDSMAQGKANATVMLAYLNWSQVEDWRKFKGKSLLDKVKKKGIPILAVDPAWPDEKIIDFSHPNWSVLFMDQVKDAANAGYNGIYFDNWPRYNDPKPGKGVSKKKKEALKAATVGIAKTIRAKYPNWKLMVNTGWEVAKKVAGVVDCILVESMWAKEDGTIRNEDDVHWYRVEIEKAQALGHHIHLLEYTGKVGLAEECQAKAEALNCGCTVVKKELAPAEYTLAPPRRST